MEVNKVQPLIIRSYSLFQIPHLSVPGCNPILKNFSPWFVGVASLACNILSSWNLQPSTYIVILDVCGLQVHHACQTCSIVHSLYKRYNNLLIRMRELIAVLDKGLQSSGFQRLLLQLPQAGLRFHSPHGLLLAFVLNCLLKFQLHLD
jgi:hypothetical protein